MTWWTCVGSFTYFHNKLRASSSSSIPITSCPPSPLSKATQLEVSCLLFCVLRDEHLAIHQPVHFASPAAGIVRYTAAIILLTA